MAGPTLSIGVVAHDQRKKDMVAWTGRHLTLLEPHRLFGTGTTAHLLQGAYPTLTLTALKSGPLGGDQQLGAMIAEGKLDCLIFLVDPMTPQPHDVDIKALIRLAQVYEIPLACNIVTADLLIRSPALFEPRPGEAAEMQARFTAYIERKIY